MRARSFALAGWAYALPARLRKERGDLSNLFMWGGGALVAALIVAGIATGVPGKIATGLETIVGDFLANTPASP